MMDVNNRLELPSKEEVLANKNVEDLRDWETDIELVINKIGTDLEFIDGDDEWRSRARMALAAHKMVLGWVKKQIYNISKSKNELLGLEQQNTKLAKQQLKLEKTQIIAEQTKIAKERSAITLDNRKINFLQSLSFSNAFMTCARSILEQDLFQQVWESASAKIAETNKKELYGKALTHD